MRRRPKAPPHGPSASTPYPFGRTFAPPPLWHRTTWGRSGAVHLTCRRCRRRSSCSRCGEGGAPSCRPERPSCPRGSAMLAYRHPINRPKTTASIRRPPINSRNLPRYVSNCCASARPWGSPYRVRAAPVRGEAVLCPCSIRTRLRAHSPRPYSVRGESVENPPRPRVASL